VVPTRLAPFGTPCAPSIIIRYSDTVRETACQTSRDKCKEIRSWVRLSLSRSSQVANAPTEQLDKGRAADNYRA